MEKCFLILIEKIIFKKIFAVYTQEVLEKYCKIFKFLARYYTSTNIYFKDIHIKVKIAFKMKDFDQEMVGKMFQKWRIGENRRLWSDFKRYITKKHLYK